MMKLLLSLAAVIAVRSQNCQILVPATALTVAGTGVAKAGVSTGLAGPWFVSGLGGTVCSQLVPTSAVLVEVTIFDTATNKFSVYYPLVVDVGSTVAAPIVPPVLTGTSVVGIWFGANGMTTTLAGPAGAVTNVAAANCVNGASATDIFGQFAACNTVAFWAAVNKAVLANMLATPINGITINGDPCPTTRHFGVVDQDQSDNVVATYLVANMGNGKLQVAQNTAANRAALNVVVTQGNGSDNRLLDVFILPAVGCTPFMAPDAIEPTVLRSSLALNEFAAAHATNIVTPALVPGLDPMTVTTVVGVTTPNQVKLNLYRQAVNQPQDAIITDPAAAVAAANAQTATYCNNLLTQTGPFLALHNTQFATINAPDPAVGNNLANFLAGRFVASWQNLNCQTLIGKACPIIAVNNVNNVAVGSNVLTAFGPNAPSAFFQSVIPVSSVLFIVGGVLMAFLVVNVLFVRIKMNQATKSGGRV